MKTIICNRFEEHISLAQNTLKELNGQIQEVTKILIEALTKGRKILLFGNGGSAADSQHLAGEFIGRFKMERKALPAIACTTDTSILTCIGNDYHFNKIFVRQVEALAVEGDVLIGISTSGNSENVLLALKSGNEIGCHTIGLLGNNGGKIKDVADYPVIVPSSDTPRIQEMHMLIGHTICEIVEKSLAAN